jgi:hypothetical protein
MKIRFEDGEKEDVEIVGTKIANVCILSDSEPEREQIEQFVTDDGYDFVATQNGNGEFVILCEDDDGVYIPREDMQTFVILK